MTAAAASSATGNTEGSFQGLPLYYSAFASFKPMRVVSGDELTRGIENGSAGESGGSADLLCRRLSQAPGDRWIGVVCGHQPDRYPADGRPGALWLLHFPGRPTGLRRGRARGVS